jgi:serine/threonine-protein kinase
MAELDQPFGKVALELGLISREQLDECTTICDSVAKMGVQYSFQEILLRKGYITNQEILEVFRVLVKEGVRPRVGNFEILSKVAEGGMGTVYKARQVSLDRIVALKVLPPHLARDQAYLHRFVREAKTAGRLSHPNIVTTLDVGESQGFHYIAMEYVEGPTVREMIREQGRILEAAAVAIVTQVAAGLAHAARFNIIHRDIKPSNIIVAQDGTAKLCDLGLAKQLFGEDASVTESGAAVGTPNYMAPEQAQGKSGTDARSDIYSLGATFYHMMAGAPPFEGHTTLEVLRQQMWDPVSPKEINSELSNGVCEIVHRMMARDPQYRYQTAAELLTDLNAHKEDLAAGAAFERFSRAGRNRPPAAKEPAPRRQAARKMQTWQVALMGAIVGGVLLVALLAFWSTMPTESDTPPVSRRQPPAPASVAPAQAPAAHATGAQTPPCDQAEEDRKGEKAYLNAVQFESQHDEDYAQQIKYWQEVITRAPRSRYAPIAYAQIAEKQEILAKAAAAKKAQKKK